MSVGQASENTFLTAPIGRLFVKNALPMAVIMALSGLLNVTDAVFLGRFVGPEALAALSLIFPPVMLTIALSTLVSGGMSSLYARHLGAGDTSAAAQVLARAHGLALLMALAAIVALFALGRPWVAGLAEGNPTVAAMAWDYLAIMVCATPVQFLLGLHADAWRNEGRAGMMAALSVGVTLANIALNYALIVGAQMGMAGAAWGTVIAQALGLVLLVGLRGRARVTLGALLGHRWWGGWGRIIALGAPLSLRFLGIALVSSCVLAALRFSQPDSYALAVAAYGIVTRLLSFVFLPMMAMGFAVQSITGNNAGGGRMDRARAVLRLAVIVALVYGLAVELVLIGGGQAIAAGFSDDAAVQAEVSRILRWMCAFYLVTGPVMMVALWFQALGQPGRTALLTLVKPFVLTPVLIALAVALGSEAGLWLAFPLSDLGMMGLAAWLFLTRNRSMGRAPA
ncbi:MATE family efflux transporter [Pararhodobacter sp. CCB-MM2]|uniref:MATE family efflux transporter n=1 Tax=Pararhodobacter sp. CCB-MM2 TaxID=1786003 RepID=UPI0008370601|nr:MATE family efflux transporter [Pararhodobacter sp. CCB-MM2]